MATAAEKKAAKEAAEQEAAALAAAEQEAAEAAAQAAELAAVEAESTAPVEEPTETPAGENPADTPQDAPADTPSGLSEDDKAALDAVLEPAGFELSDDPAVQVQQIIESAAAEADAAESTEADEPAPTAGPIVTEEEDALAKAAAVRGVAVSPLEAPEPVANVAAQNSDPNVPEGLNAVIESYAERNDGAYLAAEDGQPIDLDALWLGPNALGALTSTVRIVEHSTVAPYGHPVTCLVIGAGVSVPAQTALAITARLRAQAEAAGGVFDLEADQL